MSHRRQTSSTSSDWEIPLVERVDAEKEEEFLRGVAKENWRRVRSLRLIRTRPKFPPLLGLTS